MQQRSRPRSAGDDSEETLETPITDLCRIANLLALLLVKDVEQQQEKVMLLTAAGFPLAVIARLLRIPARAVSDSRYDARIASKAPKRGRKR